MTHESRSHYTPEYINPQTQQHIMTPVSLIVDTINHAILQLAKDRQSLNFAERKGEYLLTYIFFVFN